MKTFREFLLEKKVKKEIVDIAEAASLLKQAQERLQDLLTLPLSESNASFRFESAYESIREALQSFLAREGYKPYSHEAIIVFALEHHLLNDQEAASLDRYREKRNDINYRGQKVLVIEAQEIISFAKSIVNRLKRGMK